MSSNQLKAGIFLTVCISVLFSNAKMERWKHSFKALQTLGFFVQDVVQHHGNIKSSLHNARK